MSRTPERLMRERMRAAVMLIVERTRAASEASGGAVLSHFDLARVLGLSVNQVRCVLRRLATQGFVVVVPRFLPNGGQLENSFHVTPDGIAFLLDVEEDEYEYAPCVED